MVLTYLMIPRESSRHVVFSVPQHSHFELIYSTMASTKSGYVFPLLSALGLLAQWGAMIANGTLLGLIVTAWTGQFPDGAPMRTTWTGLWPIDYILGLLVAFFYPLLNVTELDNPAPILLLTDLLVCLTVFGFMTTVQGQRRNDTSLLRYPAIWTLAWEFFGAASTMPLYLHTYINAPAPNTFSLPEDQAQTLPFMAIWAALTNLPLLLPGIMGASPFVIQLSIVAWFFFPLVAGFVQNCTRTLSSCCRFSNPVGIGYGIVGSVSAIVHIAVGLRAYSSPEMSWTGMYWPAYSAVQPGPSLLLQGGTLFCQYGHMSLYSSVIALSVYTVGQDIFAAKSSSSGTARAGRLMASAIAVMAIFGPGAGAAWLLYTWETGMKKPIAGTKHL
ncbi:hypothetical protein F4859DRAFT_426533 [Xylaria cf. heliscus]|nr:hypothetical protein F4859DRAFT_426533 [Xylaria cf. heliscus]